MIKLLIVFSLLATVLGQGYIMNNLVDFDDTPYQRLSSPYYRKHDYKNKGIMNVRNKLVKNAIMGNSGYEIIEHPTSLIETGEVITSLSKLQTSLMSTISAAINKLLNGLQSAMKLFTVNIPAIALGATVTIGFCKITSLCSKFSSIKSITNALTDFSSFVTPDSLNMISKFIEQAVTVVRS